MGNREETEKLIQDTITENYQKIRLCSFPTLNENILLWSHYANSHKELCIAFATNTLPFVACLKVKYQDEYPYLELTITGDSRGFKSVLTKSRSWTYKNEYRSILYPTTENQHPNDGEAYFFSPDFIAKLNNGRVIIIEYKDEAYKTNDNSVEERLVGDLWEGVQQQILNVIGELLYRILRANQIKSVNIKVVK